MTPNEGKAALIERLTLMANEKTPNGVRSYLQADILALLGTTLSQPSADVGGEALTEHWTHVAIVRAALPFKETFSTEEVEAPGLTQKQVYNALAYLCRRGDIAHIGYGRYQRPPDFEQRVTPTATLTIPVTSGRDEGLEE